MNSRRLLQFALGEVSQNLLAGTHSWFQLATNQHRGNVLVWLYITVQPLHSHQNTTTMVKLIGEVNVKTAVVGLYAKPKHAVAPQEPCLKATSSAVILPLRLRHASPPDYRLF